MLLESAVGDAYGAGFEYAQPRTVKEFNNLSGYRSHHKLISPGDYTDDTQQSIAVAELLVERTEWTKLNIANKLVDVFKRDKRFGYSGRMYQLFDSVVSGSDFLYRIDPNGDTSGAAMRAAPIGVLPDVKEVVEKSQFQASITHDTLAGRMAACASSLLTHYFVYDLGAKKDVGKFINSQLQPPTLSPHLNWDSQYNRDVGSKGWMSVRAAITAVKNSNSMSELLLNSITPTGDVDTVATIALAAGSFCKEVVQDLPQHLIDGLENGKYGKDYLTTLDNKLLSLRS